MAIETSQMSFNDNNDIIASHKKTTENEENMKYTVIKPKTLVTMKYSNLIENPLKEYTPKEKLLINKLKKADEEAAKIR